MRICTLTFHCFFVALLALASGCAKTEKEMESLTVSQGDTLKYSLGGFGDEEGASINTAPGHALFSELKRDIESGEITYLYVPESDYIGSDYVELRSARGSDGASKNRNITVTKLNIDVVE